MTLYDNKYYIKRIGDFATNGNKKIMYSFFSIFLCFDDYVNNQSYDCFRIMLGSTFVWTLIEIYLNISKTRVIKPMYITMLHKKKIRLPKYVGIFLQGFQEGGVVTTFGLYFGDRLFDIKYLLFFHIFIFYIIINMSIKKSNGKIVSKRQINTPVSIGTMGYITLYNLKTLYYNPLHFYRQFAMFFSMIYVCSIWTIIAYVKNFRTVEIQIKNDNNQYIVKKHTHWDSLLILGYDVIFEIGFAYLTFYNWFIL